MAFLTHIKKEEMYNTFFNLTMYEYIMGYLRQLKKKYCQTPQQLHFKGIKMDFECEFRVVVVVFSLF